jgi:anion-transporting  ArsA/GET3 family ATPase
MLGKAWYHTTELLPNGAHRFDVVLLDAPATGHGLDLLRGPKVILDIAPPGLLRREAVRAWKLFSDPNLAGIVVVTLPEEMPITESVELLSAIHGSLKLPVARIIVNQFLPPLFSPQERDELQAPRELDPYCSGDLVLACGARRSRREMIQTAALARLRESSTEPITFLPHLFDEVAGIEAVQELAKRI